MFGDRIIYRTHAIRRMFERFITEADISQVLRKGQIIEAYPSDLPYPSQLMLGFIDDSPLHVVAAYNEQEDETIVVTVYRPDPELWSADMRTRKKL